MPVLLLLMVFCLSLIPSLSAATVPATDTVALQLRSQPINAAPPLLLSSSDRQWLAGKRSLRLGVGQDLPPLDISHMGPSYQGLSADVFSFIASRLGLKAEVYRYADQQHALQALARGEIDLVSASNRFGLQLNKLQLSDHYLEAQPILVGYHAPEQRSVRIGMARNYQPTALLRQHYPEADLSFYNSVAEGLAALQAHQIDLFMGDATAINYMSNQNIVDDLKVINTLAGDDGWSFALGESQSHLRNLVNLAIAQIQETQHQQLIQRWSGGMLLLQPHVFPIDFTPEEQAWLKQHPVLRVAAGNSFAPISFFDDQGIWRGLSAELLEQIAPRIGVKLELVRAHSLEKVVELLRKGLADLSTLPIRAGNQHSALVFSEPISDLSYNLVVRSNADSPQSLADLAGRVVVINRGLLEGVWRTLLPNSTIKLVNNPVSAFDMVDKGNADAALVVTMSSRYYLPLLFNNKLREVNITGLPDNILVLAMPSDRLILQSIINKVLASIGPEQLDNMVNERWRTNIGASNQSWYDYSLGLIYLVILVASLLLLVSLAWNSRLRKQIAKRQSAEKALSDQLNFMTTLIDVTPYPVYVLNRKGHLLSCNEHYLQALSLSRDEAMAHRDQIGVLIDIDEKTRSTLAQDYQLAIEYGVPIQRDREVLLNKQSISAFHWIQPFRDTEGVIRGVICGWIDISERRRLIEELQAAKDQADKASQAKTTFLATMSHEIRTPMSAVIGMLELALRQAEQGTVDQPTLQVAYDSAQGLLGLIGDILDIVRIESGHLSLHPESCNLLELLRAVVRVFDGLARQKQLGLFLDIDPETPADWQLMLDPLRFKQILSNLLSNAIKFTGQGSVTIRARQSHLPDQKMLIQIRVTDTGIGISEDDQQRLFRPFGQAPGSQHNVSSGTGLGLVISRTLCEMMDGSLKLSSRQHEGTRLDLELRLPVSEQGYLQALAPSEAPPLATPAARHSLNILVVDDNAANRLLLPQQLQYLGHHTRVAANGREGLVMWQQGQFDVVFTDCNMPEMNGYQLTQAIRQQEEREGSLPVVVLGFTANALPDERERCLDAGMDDCLFKPIGLAGLRACLQQQMDDRPDTHAAADSENDPGYSLDELSFMEPAQLQQLLSHLQQGLQDDMAALESMALLGNAAGVGRIAHQIKGAARIIDAAAVIQSCQALEAYCLAHELIHAEQPEVQTLTMAVAALQRSLGVPSNFSAS